MVVPAGSRAARFGTAHDPHTAAAARTSEIASAIERALFTFYSVIGEVARRREPGATSPRRAAHCSNRGHPECPVVYVAEFWQRSCDRRHRTRRRGRSCYQLETSRSGGSNVWHDIRLKGHPNFPDAGGPSIEEQRESIGTTSVPHRTSRAAAPRVAGLLSDPLARHVVLAAHGRRKSRELPVARDVARDHAGPAVGCRGKGRSLNNARFRLTSARADRKARPHRAQSTG